MRRQLPSAFGLGFLAIFIIGLLVVSAHAGRKFNVIDDIDSTHFGDPYTARTEAITESPDGKFAVIHTERGDIKNNRVEDQLRVYDLATLKGFVNQTGTMSPLPLWAIPIPPGSLGPVATGIRWLSNSSAFAFSMKTQRGGERIFLASVKGKKVQPITPEDLDVTAFDIRDTTHYVFGVRDLAAAKTVEEESAPSFVGSGRSLWELLFPEETTRLVDRSILWAAVGGPPKPVINPLNKKPVVLYLEGKRNLAISPNGGSVVTVLALEEVPREWETLYPPPYSGMPYQIRSGKQDLGAPFGFRYAGEYVIVDLTTGIAKQIAGAPTGSSAGWDGPLSGPSWSDDGTALVLPTTFIPSSSNQTSNLRPCVAVVDLSAKRAECVEGLKHRVASGFEPDYKIFNRIQFLPGRRDAIAAAYLAWPGLSQEAETYTRSTSGRWERTSGTSVEVATRAIIKLSVAEGINDPPVLLGTDPKTKKTREIWDPNPQYHDIEFGGAAVIHWKDGTGREWQAILFKPPGYVEGSRYPLVIQPHGFTDKEFRPSGMFPSALAARELAASGFVVLQMRDCEGRATPDELSCNALGYESAVNELVRTGLVDSTRIGIVGFSRTVGYVLNALTSSKLHFGAASITDGVYFGYSQYLISLDGSGGAVWEFESMLGGPPYGDGLQKWFEHSPEFNLDKIKTPLLVVSAQGRGSRLSMWAPYALLHRMGKPVDLIVLNADEHVFTNPAVRLVSQGGTVDWFRFWLQGYEDPDSEKAAQYRRWEGLCDQQINEKTGHPTFCVPAKHWGPGPSDSH